MEVIAQYEEELKRVKEELHIYQRRERMNNAQSSPSPSCSTAVEPTKVAPKLERVSTPSQSALNTLGRLPTSLAASMPSLAGITPYGLAAMNPAMKGPLNSLGIPIPNLNGFNPQVSIGQLPIPRPTLQGTTPADLSAFYTDRFQNHH